MATVPLPQFTDGIDLRYFIEPLHAPAHPLTYLDRFPDQVYGKSIDSHLVRFLYALLGPVGVGWLKLNLTEARLALEASGADLADLEAGYGNPFLFARIASESYDYDTAGLLPAAVWDQLRAKDEAYRSRAIAFLKAAGQGTTPLGMQLAATSGTGQNVEIIENYQYLFDSHSDDPLGLAYYGKSLSTNEFIVLPRPAISRSAQQTIDFPNATVPLSSHAWVLTLNGFSTPIPPASGALGASSSAPQVQTALEQVFTIGLGNVVVTGGPYPAPFIVTFTGTLSNQTLPALSARIVDGTGSTLGTIPVTLTTGAVNPNLETVAIGDADRHHMQVALDYLRPVNSYPTFYDSRSYLSEQPWDVSASSRYTQVLRFVTGTAAVSWPAVDNTHWIVPAEEIEAPQLHNTIRQHYVGFHNISTVTAYTGDAIADLGYGANSALLSRYNSVHIGPFPEMATVMPYFSQFTDAGLVFAADRCLADYAEPLTISAQTADGTAYINNIYPADYLSLQGVPQLKYHNDHFWSSQSRPSGAEVLEIDLGSPQAVNYISLEVSRKPVTIEVDYDRLDQSPARTFAPVVPIAGFPLNHNLFFDPSQQNPWESLELYFNDGLATIFTRFIRLVFTRRSGGFLLDSSTGVQTPWSVEVRNLRIGRNVAPTVLS